VLIFCIENKSSTTGHSRVRYIKEYYSYLLNLVEIKREQQKRSLELRLKEIAIEHGINSTSEYKIVTSKFIENSK